jgi:hypothetical protein
MALYQSLHAKTEEDKAPKALEDPNGFQIGTPRVHGKHGLSFRSLIIPSDVLRFSPEKAKERLPCTELRFLSVHQFLEVVKKPILPQLNILPQTLRFPLFFSIVFIVYLSECCFD